MPPGEGSSPVQVEQPDASDALTRAGAQPRGRPGWPPIALSVTPTGPGLSPANVDICILFGECIRRACRPNKGARWSSPNRGCTGGAQLYPPNIHRACTMNTRGLSSTAKIPHSRDLHPPRPICAIPSHPPPGRPRPRLRVLTAGLLCDLTAGRLWSRVDTFDTRTRAGEFDRACPLN